MMVDSRPLVVLAGMIHPDGHAWFETEARVVLCEDLTEAGVLHAAAEADGILFRNRPNCTEHLMAACKRLRVVGRHGVGVDIIDLPAATRLGIPVVHAPGANAPAVAEHALMLMLNCVKRARRLERMMLAGDWSNTRFDGITELCDKTLGIVGVGNIGRRVAGLARAFGLRVLGYDPYVPVDELQRRGVEPVGHLESLLRQSDIVTFHTPLTQETRRMINAQTIATMKTGAVLINTSRGPVQDERALYEALTSGKLRAAGLDVFAEEPTPPNHPLFTLENVVFTPHVAGVSEEAYRATSLQVVGEMLRVLRGERPHVLANADLWPRLQHLR